MAKHRHYWLDGRCMICGAAQPLRRKGGIWWPELIGFAIGCALTALYLVRHK